MSKNFERAAERYRPLFERISVESPRRERERILPFEQIGWLKEAGFGAARIPREHGGDGLSFVEFFRLYSELAEADSNIAHAWRGHFEFLEVRLHHSDSEVVEFWRGRVIEHRELIGNAWSERTEKGDRRSDTRLTRAQDGGLTLDGAKHFSTGTLYADWVDVLADLDGAEFSVVVPTAADGLERLDDWDGFGQTLTGTGTTLFAGVAVEERHIDERDLLARVADVQINVFQLVLLAVLVGIGRRALSEVKEYLLAREKPVFGGDGTLAPRDDALVQSDIGRIAAAVFAAENALDGASAALDETDTSPDDDALKGRAALSTYKAQLVVVDAVLEATSRILDTVGASATSTERGLDRHWRNARIVSSHNSLRYRERNVGAFELLGRFPAPGGA